MHLLSHPPAQSRRGQLLKEVAVTQESQPLLLTPAEKDALLQRAGEVAEAIALAMRNPKPTHGQLMHICSMAGLLSRSMNKYCGQLNERGKTRARRIRALNHHNVELMDALEKIIEADDAQRLGQVEIEAGRVALAAAKGSAA